MKNCNDTKIIMRGKSHRSELIFVWFTKSCLTIRELRPFLFSISSRDYNKFTMSRGFKNKFRIHFFSIIFSILSIAWKIPRRYIVIICFAQLILYGGRVCKKYVILNTCYYIAGFYTYVYKSRSMRGIIQKRVSFDICLVYFNKIVPQNSWASPIFTSIFLHMRRL